MAINAVNWASNNEAVVNDYITALPVVGGIYAAYSIYQSEKSVSLAFVVDSIARVLFSTLYVVVKLASRLVVGIVASLMIDDKNKVPVSKSVTAVTQPIISTFEQEIEAWNDPMNYQWIEKIGEGTYGEVWKASVVDRLGKTHHVAIKKVALTRANPLDEQAALEAVLEEERICKELNKDDSEHLTVKFYSGFTALDRITYEPNKNYRYSVYELLDGDLYDYFYKENAAKLTAEKINAIIPQMIKAVSFVHQRNVLHADVKLQNFFYSNGNDGKMRVVMGDFGMAIDLNKKGNVRSWNFIATNPYRPPEIAMHTTLGFKPTKKEKENHQGALHPAVDIWSLGMSISELYLGKRIIESEDTPVGQYQICLFSQKLLGPIPGYRESYLATIYSDPLLLGEVLPHPEARVDLDSHFQRREEIRLPFVETWIAGMLKIDPSERRMPVIDQG